YQTTEVRYGPGGLKKAQLVAAYLGVGKLRGTKNVAGADVTVVIGRDFKQVTAPTTAPPTTTTIKPTATTGPPANPGQTPGVAPQPIVGC
ncbi:MAG: LytR cell envelope-related transcriptional attenuator, partial [Actinomycetota bacterium]|nr:LytR cell envelope-related transcriptional attenuator [Actinomycetota bacterium]